MALNMSCTRILVLQWSRASVTNSQFSPLFLFSPWLRHFKWFQVSISYHEIFYFRSRYKNAFPPQFWVVAIKRFLLDNHYSHSFPTFFSIFTTKSYAVLTWFILSKIFFKTIVTQLHAFSVRQILNSTHLRNASSNMQAVEDCSCNSAYVV